MTPKSRAVKSVFSAISSTSSSQHICTSCRSTITRARYASTATAQINSEPPAISQLSPDEPAVAPEAQPRILVKAGVVVSRPPLITPDPHPFDTAFFLYQRRLNERLVLPFTQYFHYKKGTPTFEHWRTKRRERGGVAARDLGKYNAYTKESWNDEVLVGDDSASPRKIVEQLVEEEGRQNEFTGEGGDHKLAGLKRNTAADEKNDQKSLERSLSRTLYLLIRSKQKNKDEQQSWQFPNGVLEVKEGLKEAAQRVLNQSCGPNMNTWFVASHPIGHYVDKFTEQKKELDAEKQPGQQESSASLDAEKTFFMKARIFAGQADVKDDNSNVQDFKWLSKDEIEKHVTPEYWHSVRNMLVEQ